MSVCREFISELFVGPRQKKRNKCVREGGEERKLERKTQGPIKICPKVVATRSGDRAHVSCRNENEKEKGGR